MKNVSLICLVSLLGLTACPADETLIAAGQAELSERFQNAARPKLDVLWVIDNSRSMAAEQAKITTFAPRFFQALVEAKVDLHVAVITSDPADGGRFRTYQGQLPGCEGCGVITSDVGCDDATSADTCDRLRIFQEMVVVGVGGSALERPFAQAATALGISVLDDATGTPRLDSVTGRPLLQPPESNQSFLRQDADLLLVFISDEDEGLGVHAPPVRYYERLFSSVKLGTNKRLLVGALAGWPAEGAFEGASDDVCRFVDQLDDSLRSQLASQGCVDANDSRGYADPGLRYAELTCRLGGTFARICDGDYSASLQELGDRAVNFSRSFPLAQASRLDRGSDCQLFTDDDPILDCDDDGSTDGPSDGPICVFGMQEGEASKWLIRGASDGWSWDDAQSSIVFDRDFLPAPGSELAVRYAIVRGASTCN